MRTVFSRLRGGGDAPAEAATSGDVVFQFNPKGHPDAIASRRSPEVREACKLLAAADFFKGPPIFEPKKSDERLAGRPYAACCMRVA